MDAYKLTINIKKTQYMIVSGHHNKYENVDLHIKDSQIIRTKSYKYLGVKVDQHLNYSQHINNLAGTVKNKLRTITRSASTSLLTDLQDIQTKALYRLLKLKNVDKSDLHGMAKIQRLENRRK